MESIIFVLILACLALFLIGIFSPKISLFWYKKERTRKKSAEVYGILLITLIIVLGLALTA